MPTSRKSGKFIVAESLQDAIDLLVKNRGQDIKVNFAVYEQDGEWFVVTLAEGHHPDLSSSYTGILLDMGVHAWGETISEVALIQKWQLSTESKKSLVDVLSVDGSFTQVSV